MISYIGGKQASDSKWRLFRFHIKSEIDGKQASRSHQLQTVHISYNTRDRRQTGKQEPSTRHCSFFYIASEMEGKQASRSHQQEIVHISYDIRDRRQTGKQ
jgi:hypothetical protein